MNQLIDMYRCQLCHETVPPRTRRCLIPLTRPSRYKERTQVYAVRRDGKRYAADDPGGKGHEIEREIVACPECAASAIAAPSSRLPRSS